MPNITILSNMNEPAHLDTINETLGEDPIWQALAICKISVPFNKLLNLVPRFKGIVALQIRTWCTFFILAIFLHFEAPSAYTILLGRPWLWTTNIKQNWYPDRRANIHNQ